MKRKDNNSGFFLFWRGAIMQLKITTDYAIRIVYYLACRGEVITASELAYELKIPESYIPKITKKLKEANIITACEGICGYSPEYQCGFTCWFLYRKCVERGRKRNTRIIWEKILYVSGGKGDELFHQPQSTIGAAAGRFLNPKWKYGYCKFFRSFFICKTQRWKFCDNY